MATCTFRVGTAQTTATPGTSGSFVPAAGELLVVLFCASGSANASWTVSSSIGGFTFSQVSTGAGATSTDRVQCHISDAFVSDTSSQTVTVGNAADEGNGSIIFVYSVADMFKTGTAALKQQKTLGVQTAGTPEITFDASALTGNPTFGFVSNASNPAGIDPPSGWAEDANGDLGYLTPTQGAEVCHRNSGFTGTTMTWGSASATAWGGFIVELDASGGAAPSLYVVRSSIRLN